MPRQFDRSLIPLMVKTYLNDDETLGSTSRKFNMDSKTLRKYMMQIDDKELLVRIKVKLSQAISGYHMYKKPNKSIWDELDENIMTRNQLVDWYVKNNGPDNLSVKTLISIAKEKGIRIIR